MGFSAQTLSRPLATLSLGERTRLKLAEIILGKYSLVIMDEPTNHLDLKSREKLEETLVDYNGTLILVSHDRYMMERVCNTTIAFENGKLVRRQISN